MGVTTRIVKRLIDLAGATVLLLLVWPVMLLAAVLVKLTSPGPIIFSQTRVGLNRRAPSGERRRARVPDGSAPGEQRRPGDRRADSADGRHFTLYKLRTIRTDAEKHGARFSVKNDPRVTPVDRFLRKTRIDELAQLWNVLRGDMSLVGPRPERPEFVGQLAAEIPDDPERLVLKPGLTGIAQVVNGYDNNIESFRRKFAYDLFDRRHRRFWNDVKMLWRTVGVVLTGSGGVVRFRGNFNRASAGDQKGVGASTIACPCRAGRI